ncbi:SecDF P1 head subdomain-containing protein [Amycolatopsis sp. NBRC 101858]|uniref:SecDF P1 head subdomain-containing protein n=1 Tax=Amycolatopsis sp. NBRC 101858 TaxID=3032200 RepID=UPI002556FDB4|nr:precorrin-3B C(17)-methyltransferase [Amycolatopsis sp. NBRC 101858]
MTLSAVALLTLSAGCATAVGGQALPAPVTPSAASRADGPNSLEFRKVVADASRIGGTGTGPPPSQTARQSLDPAEQTAAVRAIDCTPGRADPLAGHDDRTLPLVACGRTDNTAYLLEPEFLPGSEVTDATSGYDQQRGQWVVNLRFTSEGTKTWADFTSKNVNQQAAFVLGSQVLSAPNIQVAILDGNTQITGKFTEQQARELADQIIGR